MQATSSMGDGLSWNLIDDVRQMLSFHFMLNALRAGTVVAVAAGAIGYFMVLRRESFAGHTLAVIGFPGAAGATLVGLDPAFGYFGFCVAGAVVIAALPGAARAGGRPGGRAGGRAGGRGGGRAERRGLTRRRPDAWLGSYGDESAAIGTVQTFALACGFLFVSLYQGFLSGLNGLLFGSIIGVSDAQVTVLLAASIPCLVVLAVIGRRLLFVTVDPDVAAARGVGVWATSTIFLVLLAVAAAGTSQVTGSLLVFALLVAPAATAATLTARPALGLLLSVAVAVSVTWIGESMAFFSPYPIGFWVTSVAFAAYLAARTARSITVISGRRRASADASAAASAAGSAAESAAASAAGSGSAR